MRSDLKEARAWVADHCFSALRSHEQRLVVDLWLAKNDDWAGFGQVKGEGPVVKAYVCFTSEELPWYDESTVYLVRNGNPGGAVRLLAKAFENILEAKQTDPVVSATKWPVPSFMPVLASTHLIAVDPMVVLPHSRILRNRDLPSGTSDKDLVKRLALPEQYTAERVAPKGDFDYLYTVHCGADWHVEVSKKPEIVNPCGEIRLEDGVPVDRIFKVIYSKQDIRSLHQAIERKRAFRELGGEVENF